MLTIIACHNLFYLINISDGMTDVTCEFDSLYICGYMTHNEDSVNAVWRQRFLYPDGCMSVILIYFEVQILLSTDNLQI